MREVFTIITSANENKTATALFLDTYKFFDDFLSQFKSYGIAGRFRSRLTSFLTSRSKTKNVKGFFFKPPINNQQADLVSLLIPLTFHIHFSDLLTMNLSETPFLFRDNTNIFCTFHSIVLDCTLHQIAHELHLLNSLGISRLLSQNFSVMNAAGSD